MNAIPRSSHLRRSRKGGQMFHITRHPWQISVGDDLSATPWTRSTHPFLRMVLQVSRAL